MLTREQAIARMCALQRRVCEDVIGYTSANDCFCWNEKEGGTTHLTEATFMSSGLAIEWIEHAVEGAIARHKATAHVPKDSEDAGA